MGAYVQNMPSQGLRVSMVKTPEGIKIRRVVTRNGSVMSDQTSMSPSLSSSASRVGSARNTSLLSPNRSYSMLHNSPLSFSMPMNHYMGTLCAAHNSPNALPGVSLALSPYAHMPMSRVFRQPTKRMKSAQKVQQAISQLSSSTTPASIKKAQSHLSAALRINKKR